MSDAVDNIFTDLPAGSLRLLQITDTHLFADTRATLMGLNTQQSLENLLAHAASQQKVDLILATGDLVHDATEPGYRRFMQMLKPFALPVLCLPGNHDVPAVMRKILNNGQVKTPDSHHQGDWLMVFLDTTVAEKSGGHLCAGELQRLENTLAEHPDLHVLICMHHNPVPVNSRWLDTMMIANSDDFFAIIDRHAHVKGVLWGHVHQEYDEMRSNVRLLASPSTCIQFADGHEEFSLDMQQPPGCRWLALLPDGEIRTAVTRLAEMPEGIVNSHSGY